MPATILDRLAEANPVDPLSLRGAAEHPAALALRDRIESSPLAPAGSRPPARRRVRAIAAAVAVVAVLAALVPTTILPDERLGVPSAAAQALDELATTVASQADQPPASAAGPVLYTRKQVIWSVTGVAPEPFTVLVPHTIETWAAANGVTRIRDVAGSPLFPSERDRERWIAAGSAAYVDRVSDTRSSYEPTLSYLPAGCDDVACAVAIQISELPADPVPLGELLDRYADYLVRTDEQDREAAIFRKVTDLLGVPSASADLKAAIYQVAAALDRIQLLSGDQLRGFLGQIERVGRIPRARLLAVGLVAEDSGAPIRYELVADRESGAVVATRRVLLERTPEIGAEPPVVLSQEVVESSGWVGSLTDRPGA